MFSLCLILPDTPRGGFSAAQWQGGGRYPCGDSTQPVWGAMKADALDVSDIRWQLWDENIDPICRQKFNFFFFMFLHATPDRQQDDNSNEPTSL